MRSATCASPSSGGRACASSRSRTPISTRSATSRASAASSPDLPHASWPSLSGDPRKPRWICPPPDATCINAKEVNRLSRVVKQVPACWSESYVLRHCTGFRVEGPSGLLGYVEEVVLDAEGNAPEALLVRGTRTIEVPASRIRRLIPGQERVLVGSKARR